MPTPKNLAELEALLLTLLPGATVETVAADPGTWEVMIRTNKFLANGDETATLYERSDLAELPELSARTDASGRGFE